MQILEIKVHSVSVHKLNSPDTNPKTVPEVELASLHFLQWNRIKLQPGFTVRQKSRGSEMPQLMTHAHSSGWQNPRQYKLPPHLATYHFVQPPPHVDEGSRELGEEHPQRVHVALTRVQCERD